MQLASYSNVAMKRIKRIDVISGLFPGFLLLKVGNFGKTLL